jgi:hypothetical protein
MGGICGSQNAANPSKLTLKDACDTPEFEMEEDFEDDSKDEEKSDDENEELFQEEGRRLDFILQIKNISYKCSSHN